MKNKLTETEKEIIIFKLENDINHINIIQYRKGELDTLRKKALEYIKEYKDLKKEIEERNEKVKEIQLLIDKIKNI